ncbi:PsiF family protein [Enterobacteriaceae bacterium LUAb1]
MNKTLLTSCVLTILMIAGSALAAEKTAQQQKMTRCNQQAGAQSLKGDERKAFMSDCLKKDNTAVKKVNSQQAKMKTCNLLANNKALKGDARKSFMSSCLKKQ